MSPEIVSALIAASVSIIASAISLFIGMRGIKIEREKLKTDRERFQVELRDNAEQARITKAELAKLKAETEKLSVETDEIRIRRIESERSEIRNLLLLFERAFFDLPLPCDEPLAMFRAIQQTRISLQMSGASLIRNMEVAEHFKQVRNVLREIEYEIEKQYPEIVKLADILKDEPLTMERQRILIGKLGNDFRDVVRLIMIKRESVQEHLSEIKKYLRKLDEQMGSNF
jgi:hypothetical protein